MQRGPLPGILGAGLDSPFVKIAGHETVMKPSGREYHYIKETNRRYLYEVHYFPVRGHGAADDILHCGVRTAVRIVPVILVRLVSNSAATGLVLDIFKEFGTDSSIGLIASILMSSTETVLYCMSVYFGSVGIRKTRYTLAGGLIATAAGVAVSVVLAGAVSG